MTRDDLTTLERDVFRKFYDDGLFDVLLGLVLMMMAVGAVIDRLGLTDGASLVVTMACYATITVGMILLRRRVVLPRLGTFKPVPARMRRIKATRLVLLASVALGIVAFAVPALGTPPAGIVGWIPLIFLANCVVVFGLMAYFLDVPRFLLYGFLFPAPEVARFWLPPYDLADTLVAFGLPAAIIVSIGVYKLVRFLRDYPVRDTGVPGVS